MKTNFNYLLLAGLVVFGVASPVGARQWKDVDGRAIEADFVSANGESAVIRKGGKEFTIPLKRLSPEVFAKGLDWLESNPQNAKPNKSKN